MTGLFEIFSCRAWMISPSFVASTRPEFERNLNGRIPFSAGRKVIGKIVSLDTCTQATCVKDEDGNSLWEYGIGLETGKAVSTEYLVNIKEPFVQVLTIDGPITRSGDACSYGSKDHRDMIFTAADNDLCRGHLFYINTPGGTAWAINDYKQAIDYAHSKKQPVLAFVDGDCMSAGMYLAAMCDERYYMHANNEVGCIGVMAGFYTLADGEKDYSGETYHEIYDPESFDKNKFYRDIANDNNTDLLVEKLAELGREFRADVKKHCPNAKEEHLHGKIFKAKDVRGILMNGQSSFGGCLKRCAMLYDSLN